jgi:hypothetical protein
MTTTIKRCTTQDVETLRKLSIETYTDTFAAYNTVSNTQAYIDSAYDIKVLLKELSDVHSEFYFYMLIKNLPVI